MNAPDPSTLNGQSALAVTRVQDDGTAETLDLNALCPNGCPHMECYCPDGSEPRWCGHGPGGTCDAGHCLDCDACYCGEEW